MRGLFVWACVAAILGAGCEPAEEEPTPVEVREEDPTPEVEPGEDGPSFAADMYQFDPKRPVDEPPGEGWCSAVPTANQGINPIPQTALDLLATGLTLDPAQVTCPTDFETWPPFVRRHTGTYTATRRWGGFNECVPQIDLEGRYDGVFITHTPLVTANYGVLRFGDILRGLYTDTGWTIDPIIGSECPDPVQNVLDQAEWLDEHAVSRPHEGVDTWAWEYDFVNLQGELEAPWTSAYAQAVAATAYMAAYCVSDQDERWLRGAEKAMLNLITPMSAGGTGTWENDTAVWFEEAAADEAFSARSLNGHLGALAALWAVAQWTNNPHVQTLVDYGINAPLGELDKYDAEFISLYTQWAIDYPFIAPKHDYNRFHVQQLSWLYELTGDSRAMDSALKFARYDDPHQTVELSTRQFGTEDFWEQWVYHPQWWTVAPGWIHTDLTRTQTIDRVILWSPDPAMIHTDDVLRPSMVDIDTSTNGVFWDTHTFEWPDQCNDGVFDIPPTDARYVKIWLHSPNRQEQPFIGLQAYGIRRVSGHPSGVAQWLSHAYWNRPSMAFGEEGFAYSRIGWQIFDLDGAFPTGFELLFEGWRGPTDPIPMEPFPTLTAANDLDGPWTPVEVTPRMIGPYLAYQIVGDPGFRYMKVDIDVRFNPLAPGKLYIRNL